MAVADVLREAGPYILQGYEFDATAQRYRADETGRFVARARILELVERSTADRQDRMRAGLQSLMDGDTSLAAWYARTSVMLQREWLQNAALAAGGWDRLTPADQAGLEARVAAELDYLHKFGQEMAGGKVSAAQAESRMNMYIGHARSEFYRIERDRLAGPGKDMVTIERRNLAAVKHCEQCIEYHDLGWQMEGMLPLPTEQCDCDGNCRCEVERRQVPASQAEGWIGRRGGPGDDMDAAGLTEGGPGSGNWGHAGRPGEVGGSSATGVAHGVMVRRGYISSAKNVRKYGPTIREQVEGMSRHQVHEYVNGIVNKAYDLDDHTGRPNANVVLKAVPGFERTLGEQPMIPIQDGPTTHWFPEQSGGLAYDQIFMLAGENPIISGAPIEPVPLLVAEHTKDVFYMTGADPDDSYFAGKYHMPGFQAVGSAGDGSASIDVWHSSLLDTRLASHEMAHNYAQAVWGTTVPPADSTFAKAAASGEPPVREYGKVGPQEDFATAVEIYCTDPLRMQREFPQRYEAVHAIAITRRAKP